MNNKRFLNYTSLTKMILGYLKKIYLNQSFVISLSDGEEISLDFPKKNVPHLFGLDVDKCKKLRLLDVKENGYAFFLNLLNYPTLWYEHITKALYLPIEEILSPFYQEKMESLQGMLRMTPQNIAFICKYDPHKHKLVKEGCMTKSDYLIFFRKKDGYSVLGIVKGRKGNFYFPMSNLNISDDKLPEWISYQTLLFPVRVQSKRYDETVFQVSTLSLEEKMKKIDFLHTLELQYNCALSNAHEHSMLIRELLDERRKWEMLLQEKNKEIEKLQKKVIEKGGRILYIKKSLIWR